MNAEQMGFFYEPPPKTPRGKARHTDPTPSHDAAVSVNAARQKAEIVRVLKAAKGRKMTVKEIADVMSKGKSIPIQANAISPRFAPMEREGILVRGNKDEREAYKSSVRCDVWGLKKS